MCTIFNIDPPGRPSGPWPFRVKGCDLSPADFGCFWPIFDELLRVSFRASSKTPCYLYIFLMRSYLSKKYTYYHTVQIMCNKYRTCEQIEK